MGQVQVVKGSPLGVEPDFEEQVVSLSFVLENGDHLHVLIGQQQLDTLIRHSEYAASKIREQKPHGK